MNLIKIGKLRKPFGVDGRLKIEVSDQHKSILNSIDVIFLKRQDGDIPYFVEEINFDTPPTIILEDVDTPELASELSMNDIYIRSNDLNEDIDLDKSLSTDVYVGFTLFDGDEEIGVIKDILDYPQQKMAQIMIDDFPVLIPLVETFIVSKDVERKTLICDLPGGLVESQLKL